jgi:hypothetical protein
VQSIESGTEVELLYNLSPTLAIRAHVLKNTSSPARAAEHFAGGLPALLRWMKGLTEASEARDLDITQSSLASREARVAVGGFVGELGSRSSI